MRRAAVSIASNIAEGCERGTDADACRFFYVARGSAGELLTQVLIAQDVELVEAKECASIVGECEEISRMIPSLIAFRQRQIRPCPLPLVPRA
jgi:four helix bundle protein